MGFREVSGLAALFVCTAGCTASGFLVNGRHMTLEELSAYQGAWRTESLTTVGQSRVSPDERPHVLNLIAHQEITGTAPAAPCSTLLLTDVVPIPGTHLQAATGEMFGPLDFAERWRVLACEKKHSWVVFEDRRRPGKPTAMYLAAPGDDEWLQATPKPAYRQ